MSGPGSSSGGASFECSLAGTVLQGQFQHLYDRLLGLCEHAAHSKMLEHELLFTPSVPRPLYAPRNDDVHLRLRVRLTVLDHAKKQQQQGEGDNRRKKLKSHHDNGGDGATAVNGTESVSAQTNGEDTEMASSTQETGTQPAADGAVAQPSSASLAPGSTADPTQSTTALAAGEAPPATLTNEQHLGPKIIVTRQYQLCQYGHPEPGRTIVVRSAILVRIHGDAFGFLSLLGYGFEDEFLRRGYSFMYNNICRISVFRKYKLSRQHDPFSAIVPEEEAAGGQAADTASPWLVEISSSFVSQENVNSMSDEINVVRNLLAASVTF
ncbi:hypothetical protein B0O80DRAFT_449177 [Mortierella sp. GBAus27b]|nr:hypothetical protein BGX31_000618 [Mortierella sp. GBA43]KAI8355400.1 hypothetical protein B0O80DRAFT_449177 [Mortierella sp. GBAus27b]